MKTKKLIAILTIIISLLILIIVLILLTGGEVKTSGAYPDDVEGQSLSCESHSIKYPIFANNDAKSRDLLISANFYNRKLNAISLTYTLFYDTDEQIKASEAQNHAAMNIDFGKNSLPADAFDANYSKMSNAMKMLIYANEKEFNPISAKYFMINVEEGKDAPEKIDEFEKIYKKQGFVCSKNE